MAHFEGLPTEVLVNIFQHLDKKSLKAVRLSSPNFTLIVPQFLFRKIVVKATPIVPKKVHEILKRDSLSVNVKELRFDGSRFRDNLATPADRGKFRRIAEIMAKHEVKISHVYIDHGGLLPALVAFSLNKITSIEHLDAWISTSEQKQRRKDVPDADLVLENLKTLAVGMEVKALVFSPRNWGVFPSVLAGTKSLEHLHVTMNFGYAFGYWDEYRRLAFLLCFGEAAHVVRWRG